MLLFTEIHLCYILLAFTFVGSFLGLSLFRRRGDAKTDAREPFNIPQKVPYVGHLIGMLQYGLRYFDMIRLGNNNSSESSKARCGC